MRREVAQRRDRMMRIEDILAVWIVEDLNTFGRVEDMRKSGFP